MTTPYTSVSVSGYNSAAPPDDGSTGSNNTVEWAKHKTKLGDPLKTAIEQVNTNLVTAFGKIFGSGVTAKSAGFTLGSADQGKWFTCSAALTVATDAAATVGTNFCAAIYNSGSVTEVTINPNASETINGLTSLTIAPGCWAIITTDGSNWQALLGRPTPYLMTEVNAVSGTSKDFTSIPPWASKITVMFNGVSTNGTDPIIIQIGDSGGVEVVGYLGGNVRLTDATAVVGTNFTNGFGIDTVAAGAILHGSIVLTLEDRTNQTWIAHGIIASSASARVVVVAGSKTLTGGVVLDRVRITTTGGADTFDATGQGDINLLIE